PVEQMIFNRALRIHGLRIGFDLEGTITADISDRDDMIQRLQKRTLTSEEMKQMLRPGIKALLIGLLAHNSVPLITSAFDWPGHPYPWLEGFLDHFPLLKKWKAFSGFELIDGLAIEQRANKWQERKYGEGLSKGLLFEGVERNLLPRLKLPSLFWLDLLVDDSPQVEELVRRYGEAERLFHIDRLRILAGQLKEGFLPLKIVDREESTLFEIRSKGDWFLKTEDLYILLDVLEQRMTGSTPPAEPVHEIWIDPSDVEGSLLAPSSIFEDPLQKEKDKVMAMAEDVTKRASGMDVDELVAMLPLFQRYPKEWAVRRAVGKIAEAVADRGRPDQLPFLVPFLSLLTPPPQEDLVDAFVQILRAIGRHGDIVGFLREHGRLSSG
ncbi:MAG: hypothetical protein ACRD2L_00540, partial [Terriglobia bacterium]